MRIGEAEPEPTTAQSSNVKPNNYTPKGPVGNTVGKILPDTAPNPTLNSAPAIQPTEKEDGWWKRWGSDWTHGVLDVAGFVPVLGAIPDLINAGVYLTEGDYVQAGISAVAAIPGAGDVVAAGNIGVKVGKQVVKKIEKETAEQIEKRLAKEAAERAQKEAAARAEKEAAAKKGGKDKKNCKALQNGLPGAEYRGGKYSSIKQGGKVRGQEAHHIPADSVNELGKAEGPAIQMDKSDHAQTASHDNKLGADAYRKTQGMLAKQGKAGFLTAMMMDVDDVESKFPGKYTSAIAQMMAYAKCMGFI